VYGEGDAKVRALQDVSLTINKGEFVLIVGSSGSGKSTLLNMIGLIDKPTNGKVLIDGTETTTLNDGKISAFRNHKLGFIFQFSNLLSDLTVLENVMLPRQIQGTNTTAEKDARELLKTVGLEDQMHKRANKISGDLELEEDEIISVVKIPLKKLIKMIISGKIIDSKTICAVLTYAATLEPKTIEFLE